MLNVSFLAVFSLVYLLTSRLCVSCGRIFRHRLECDQGGLDGSGRL